MQFRVLGPVEAERDGGELSLGGPKQRALLALLLLRANHVVSRDALIDGLWGEVPPPSAVHTLEDYVSRLRKAIGADRIATHRPGYVLHTGPDDVDATRFERLVADAARLLADSQPSPAAETFREALSLWRGPALADVLSAPFAMVEAARLEDARVSALERRLEAELASGQGVESVGELEALVREHPTRERFVYLLMLVLYRSGRQTNALSVFRDARQRLADELGLEPGPELQELQRQILTHDATLDLPVVDKPARVPDERRSDRRRLVLLAVLASAIAVAAAGFHFATRAPPAAAEDATSSQVVALGLETREISLRAELVGAPAAAAADATSVWLAEPDAESVSRVDVSSGDVVNRIPVPGGAGAVTVAKGALWTVAVRGGAVVRIDPATAKVTQRVGLGGARVSAIAYGQKTVWVADTADRALIGIDPDDGAIRRVVQLALQPTALAPNEDTIWAADYDANTVAEIDVATGQTLATIHVGNGPSALAIGAGAVWVANTLDSTISRIDPARGIVVATIPVGSGPAAVSVAAGSVWTADRYSGAVSRIDPAQNVVAGNTSVGGEPSTLTAAGGRLWVGLQPRVQRRGGTLRLLSSAPLSIDPAIQVNTPPPQTGGLTTDGLVTYNQAGGPAGLQLVPDLAVALPTPTDGGRTYTFRLRQGIKYSDGRFVRASDFRRALERLFQFRPINSNSFRGILGAAPCIADSATCDLSRGIVTNDSAGTVTFHLTAPDPNFLTTLTYGSLSAPVPPGTPFRSIGSRPIPGTGPYIVASASRRELRYVRNPHFREWSHAAQPDGNPDEIVMRFGLTPEQEVDAIAKGEADWMLDAVPAHLLPMVQRRYASQLRTYATPQTDWLQFNTTRAPFDDVRVRRALNFAIDRRVAIRTYGGRAFATPTCQVLPPGVPGYRRYCPYTRDPRSDGAWAAPDFGRALRLVERSGTRGTKITVWGWTDDCCLRRPLVEYTATLLRRLGYRVRTRYVSHAYLAPAPSSVLAAIQVIPVGWTDPTADNFLAAWFSCTGSGAHGWFCVQRLDRRIGKAQKLATTDVRAAVREWAALDRELVDLAAAVPLFNERWIEFVSARVRNFQHNPHLGFLAAQASVR